LALLELLNHAIEIGIAGAKAPGKPVSAALGNCLAIGKHFKLAGLARRNHGVNAEPLLDKGRETRNLGFIVLSSRAGTYLNLHSGSPNLLLGGCPVAKLPKLPLPILAIFGNSGDFGNVPMLRLPSLP
jgi:hypothetical protein